MFQCITSFGSASCKAAAWASSSSRSPPPPWTRSPCTRWATPPASTASPATSAAASASPSPPRCRRAAPGYRALLAQAQALLTRHGLNPANASHAALGLLYSTVLRQALLASYLDVFRAFGWIFLAGIPFLWLMRRPRYGKRPGAAAAH